MKKHMCCRWNCILATFLVAVFLLPMSALGASKAVVVFQEDFSQDKLGAFPSSDWVVDAREGYIEIVEAAQLPSGRAVRIASDPEQKETRITRDIEVPAGDHKLLIVEHHVRWVAGSGVNLYVMKKANNLNWSITSDGELRYRMSSGQATVGVLDPGWNSVRLVANQERNEVYVYLNDMENPAVGPLPFRVPLDSWQDISLRFQHTYAAASPSEVFYGEIMLAVSGD